MLVNVPTGVNRLARNVIINHPNCYNCEIYRRSYTRGDPAAGGMPTIGGMMVLSGEDEAEIEWALVGMGFAVPAEQFAPAAMMDRMDAHNSEGEEFRYLIEPEIPIGETDGFEPRKNDVFYLRLGSGDSPPRVAFEIVTVETLVNLPPYVPRYVSVRRDDLDLIEPAPP